MAEVGHDVLDDLFHAVEVAEGGVELEDLVGEDPRQARVEPGVDQFRFADGREHALGGGGVGHAVGAAQLEVVLQGHLFLAGRFEACLVGVEDGHGRLLVGRNAARRGCRKVKQASRRPPARRCPARHARGTGSVHENPMMGGSSTPRRRLFRERIVDSVTARLRGASGARDKREACARMPDSVQCAHAGKVRLRSPRVRRKAPAGAFFRLLRIDSMEQNQVTPSALERRIDISVSLADIEKEVDARLKRMARTVKMPGFRPGKVPMKIVAQTHGGQARGEAVGAAVEKAFGEKVRADNLRVAGYPQHRAEGRRRRGHAGVHRRVRGLSRRGPWASSPVSKIERPVLNVGDAEVDKTIEVLRKQRTSFKAVDRAAAEGDRVRDRLHRPQGRRGVRRRPGPGLPLRGRRRLDAQGLRGRRRRPRGG